jgi:hypothetical protein
MKTEVILILILTFINLSFCEEEGCYKEGVSKKSDCTSRSLITKEKSNGEDSCCLATYKDSSNTESKDCIPCLKKNVTKDYIKYIEDSNNNIKDLSINCNSKWLNFSMLFIGLFALLF